MKFGSVDRLIGTFTMRALISFCNRADKENGNSFVYVCLLLKVQFNKKSVVFFKKSETDWMLLSFLLSGLPDMQIPGTALACIQIILLGRINLVVLLNLNSIPHTDTFIPAPGTTSNRLQEERGSTLLHWSWNITIYNNNTEISKVFFSGDLHNLCISS